jgi:hypothetical protein
MKPVIHHYMGRKKQVVDAEVNISLFERTWLNDSSAKDGRESAEAGMISLLATRIPKNRVPLNF